MKILRKVYDFFAKPFQEDFIFLFIMALLVCGPRFYFHLFMQYEGVNLIVWEVTHSFLLCYFVSLPFQLIPARFKTLYKRFIYILAFIDFCIETSCIIVTQATFYTDHVSIVLGTNLSEGREFVSTYVTSGLFWVLLIAVVVILFLKKADKIVNGLGYKIAPVAVVLSLISCLYFIYKGSESWGCKFYNKFFTFISFETPPDLRPYQSPLDIEVTKLNMPDNVVLILGESFSKSHSSMYGYEKETNPCLTAMANDSLLISFSNVIAPATHTIDCVKSIMSTYKLEYKDSVNWYECTTLPNIMKHCGYTTYWISNQSPSGVFDNVATRYSELCDSVYFVGNTMKGLDKSDYDEEVIAPIRQIIVEDSKNFIIVQLMGSHFDYKMRYPEEWDVFQENDYPNLMDYQKNTIASYDNSILYNDYIVSEILNYFDSTETIAFYFSDHGQDLFDSSEEYFGHARVGNSLSETAATQIPFFVYMSRKYQENYPKETEWVKTRHTERLNTEDTIEFLYEFLGLVFH